MAKKTISFRDHTLSSKKLDDWVKTGSLSNSSIDNQVIENSSDTSNPLETNLRRLTIRIPEALHKSFKLYCVKNNITINEIILKMIRSEIEDQSLKSN